MKIKLSKSQWKEMGEKAGWIKKAQSITSQQDSTFPKACPSCKGKKFNDCSMCRGKGHITKEDHDWYLHNAGIGPCPCGHDHKA